MNSAKQPFLVVYDYGMGGVWGIVLARSEAEIAAAYPELTVVRERPSWMSEERYAELARGQTHDIDDREVGGVIRAVVRDREKG